MTYNGVYLCGPINGCTDDEAINWRDVCKQAFGDERCVDPMARDYRGREDECVVEIVEQDKAEIEIDADIVLANCWQVSWGTAMEILFAYNEGKPVVAVVPPGARISPWLRYHTTLIVNSLDAAISFIKYGTVTA